MIWLIVLYVLLLVAVAISAKKGDSFLVVIIAMLSIIFGACTVKALSEPKADTPTAIDVYRGNTTLEVTYRDSLPVDSSVVFIDFE